MAPVWAARRRVRMDCVVQFPKTAVLAGESSQEKEKPNCTVCLSVCLCVCVSGCLGVCVCAPVCLGVWVPLSVAPSRSPSRSLFFFILTCARTADDVIALLVPDGSLSILDCSATFTISLAGSHDLYSEFNACRNSPSTSAIALTKPASKSADVEGSFHDGARRDTRAPTVELTVYLPPGCTVLASKGRVRQRLRGTI